jgi:hypothetical protein
VPESMMNEMLLLSNGLREQIELGSKGLRRLM